MLSPLQILHAKIMNWLTIPRHQHVTSARVPKHVMRVDRVAELGSLSSGAKMAMKIFVKRVFTIFASNASFLRVIANLQN